MSSALSYRTVREALKGAFPQLRVCVERLEADWADDPEHLGEYIVFEDVFGTYLDVLMSLGPSAGRDRLLARAFQFVERLTSADDGEVANLGVVAFCERIECMPGWQAIADQFAGPCTWRWLDRSIVSLREPDEIIDLWGVREVIAAEGFNLPTLPGVSNPADHRRLHSLSEAQAHPEGVVILSSFGTSHPLVVAKAAGVRPEAPVLDDLARELAGAMGGEESQGQPSAKYFSIPSRERVWRMRRGREEHGRLEEDRIWVHPNLPRPIRRHAKSVLKGKA